MAAPKKKSDPPALSKTAKALLKKGLAAPMPEKTEPMLATLVATPSDESGWQYEMKWDGYRAIANLNGKNVSIFSRNQKSFDEKFYPIHKALQQWNRKAVVDGEIVVLNNEGLPDFSGLQQWRSEADGQLVYYLFDLLWLDGVSVMELPVEDRRFLLQEMAPLGIVQLRISQSIDDKGEEAFAFARQMHLEGIIAKKKGSPYAPGIRSRDWLKIKTEKRQELVIGGYTRNEGSNKQFSALLLGIPEEGRFRFVTPVGTGFTQAVQKNIVEKLKPLSSKICPFETVPDFNKPSRFRPHPPKAEVTWVKPKLVAEISYREMTSGGAIRHPSFKGLREDKTSKEVVWETPLVQKEQTNMAVGDKVIKAPKKTDRQTLLNPKEETQTRVVEGHELRFTNLSKVYWPREKLTKRDMINYYYQMAPYLLPYMKDRPQTLNRHPNGITGKTFYQKDIRDKAPEWLERFPYYSRGDEREKEFLVCSNEASILYIASLGCIEMNPWHSRQQKPDHPDWCIIDLDPDKNTFEQVIEAAQVTKKILDAAGIESYCKTSGSTGLHIYIPLEAKYTYEDSREFGRRIAKVVHNEIPEFTSIARKTTDRDRKMYVDFLQNRPQATVAAPYSLRPKPGATVSMPLHWDEVKKGLEMQQFHLKNAVERVRTEGDLFAPVIGKGIDMKKAVKKLHSLFEDVLGKN